MDQEVFAFCMVQTIECIHHEIFFAFEIVKLEAGFLKGQTPLQYALRVENLPGDVPVVGADIKPTADHLGRRLHQFDSLLWWCTLGKACLGLAISRLRRK